MGYWGGKRSSKGLTPKYIRAKSDDLCHGRAAINQRMEGQSAAKEHKLVGKGRYGRLSHKVKDRQRNGKRSWNPKTVSLVMKATTEG